MEEENPTTESETVILTRFIKGLASYNVSLADIQSGKWIYYGTDERGRDFEYYTLSSGCDKPLAHGDYCVCGHKIGCNYYITDGKRILILGSTCIKRFLPKECRVKLCPCCREEMKGKRPKGKRSFICDSCERIDRDTEQLIKDSFNLKRSEAPVREVDTKQIKTHLALLQSASTCTKCKRRLDQISELKNLYDELTKREADELQENPIYRDIDQLIEESETKIAENRVGDIDTQKHLYLELCLYKYPTSERRNLQINKLRNIINVYRSVAEAKLEPIYRDIDLLIEESEVKVAENRVGDIDIEKLLFHYTSLYTHFKSKRRDLLIGRLLSIINVCRSARQLTKPLYVQPIVTEKVKQPISTKPPRPVRQIPEWLADFDERAYAREWGPIIGITRQMIYDRAVKLGLTIPAAFGAELANNPAEAMRAYTERQFVMQ
jgi:DNA-directed RNA polymerase subunit M/transcription elongation factor TFIIS